MGMWRKASSDDGFSLAELIVVCSLLGIILSAAYAGLDAVQVASDVSNRQTIFAAEVGSPMLAVEEVLQQTFAIESASAYGMTVRTDADNDNLAERHVIGVGTDHRLTQQAWKTNALMQNTTPYMNAVWSRNNVNLSEAVPLFVYYDENHNPITNYTLVPDSVKTIRIEVVVNQDGRTFRGSRSVVLRNM